MQIVNIKISDIKPYGNNPRKNKDAVKYVKNSIKQFGFKIPMVLDKDNVIVCGHTRYMAAQELGMEEIPCTYADDLTEQQVKAFRLADNKTAEMSAWDLGKLEIELGDIEGVNMQDFGFIDDACEKIDEPLSETDSNFNYTEQYGVIVMCGDEKEQEEIYNRLTSEGYTCKVVAV